MKREMLSGVKVGCGGSVSHQRGSEAQLVDGAKVEVRGTLSDHRGTLSATQIRFED